MAIPTDIAGLQLWLKADTGVYSDAGVTPATNGQTIQQWNDQSGNNNHVSQATAGNRPTYRAATSGDTGQIEFLTSAKHLSNTGVTFPSGATAMHVFALIRQHGVGVPWSAGIGASASLELYAANQDPVIYHSGRTGSDDGQPASVIYLYEMRYDGSQATNATKLKSYNNARQLSNTFGGANFPASLPAVNGFRVGHSGSGTGTLEWLGGYLVEMAVYNAVLAGADITGLEAYFRSRAAQGSQSHVTCIGDSLTQGTGVAVANAWPNQLQTALGHTWRLWNQGISGLSANTWVANNYSGTLVTPGGSHPRDVVAIALGHNDLVSRTAAQLLTDMHTLRNAWQALGYRVGAATIPKSTALAGGAETQRTTYNTNLLADSGWDFLVDPASDAAFSAPSNTTYYQGDGIHWTVAGQTVAKGYWQTALEALPVVSPATYAGSRRAMGALSGGSVRVL